MKTKEIPCPECRGHGFISICTENSISGRTCEACHGTGLEKVPMTRADEIRSMTDEELAKKLAKILFEAQNLYLRRKRLPDKERLVAYVLEAIQKPVEEDDHGQTD